MKAKLLIPPPKMNKTEAAFHQYLKYDRDIVWLAYNCMKFMVGVKTCWYCPDFVTLNKKGQVIVYEVKGFWRDDAKVKIKAAANLYPMYKWVAVYRGKGGWRFEEFNEK